VTRASSCRSLSGLSFEQAAAVAGTMALEGRRDHAQLRAGQRIAITGATGGVGSFAVQITKALGANVTAVCRTENVELARQLGADRVFDYTREDYLADEKYDAIFDNGSGRSLRELRRAVAPDGVVVLNCGQDASLVLAGWAARLLRRREVKQFVRKVTRADLLELARAGGGRERHARRRPHVPAGRGAGCDALSDGAPSARQGGRDSVGSGEWRSC
jgi:NADPH:quinone reductase-like Zn-dependent oxidoreductase